MPNLSFRILQKRSKLYRNYKEGKRTINAFLDDYAYLIEAYTSHFIRSLSMKAGFCRLICTCNMSLIISPIRRLPCFSIPQMKTKCWVHRKTEIQDDVIPSSNASLAHSLHHLGLILHKTEYLSLSDQMLRNVAGQIINNPAWFSHWGILSLMRIYPHYEVAITGPKALDFRQKMDANYFPHTNICRSGKAK